MPARVPNASRILMHTGLAAVVSAVCTLAACGGGGSDSTAAASTSTVATATKTGTLDGSVPLVIGHRGLPGLYPEETKPAYEHAADVGADAHKAGLFVHAYTFRNETRYLPGIYGDDPKAAFLQFFAAGRWPLQAWYGSSPSSRATWRSSISRRAMPWRRAASDGVW